MDLDKVAEAAEKLFSGATELAADLALEVKWKSDSVNPDAIRLAREAEDHLNRASVNIHEATRILAEARESVEAHRTDEPQSHL